MSALIEIWSFLSSIFFSFQIFINFFWCFDSRFEQFEPNGCQFGDVHHQNWLDLGGPVCVATGLPPIVIGLTTCTWNSSLSNTKSVGKINIWANIWTSDGVSILCSGSSVMLQEATQQRVVLGLITDDCGTTARFSYKRHLRSFGRSRNNINCRKPIHTCM